ncbi:hypothetical protein [Nannocystis radixulma]|uniref:Lipoprotein n=1 Tax=Nannocystis radixulma TaxID=2995305 RepID=A0ABT5B308_9BACT|nr:hypothetical protein [Nannocystis radixulma]MDC0668050.1 hypothetical protein [Nannocystis radixulma]
MMRDYLRFVVLGVFLAGACSDKDEYKPGATVTEINAGCKSYCAKASECNKAIRPQSCEQRCQNRINRCRADEQSDTVNDLHACADDSCGDFAVCAIGAGLQCTFGL